MKGLAQGSGSPGVMKGCSLGCSVSFSPQAEAAGVAQPKRAAAVLVAVWNFLVSGVWSPNFPCAGVAFAARTRL